MRAKTRGGAKLKAYIALNKPVGITCTTEPNVRGNIVDFVGQSERIFPIGRLDKDPPCRIHALGKSSFHIVLVQELNRQIRLPCKHFGYDVKTLQRVRIMNVKLGRSKIVQSRNLTDEELKGLLPARQ